MNIIINNLKGKIISFLDYYLPDIFTACLTGSYVDQNFNEESDIDLWVLSYKRDYIFHETFIWDNLKMQVTHVPVTRINEILWNDYFTNDGTYLNAFAKSEVILDKNDYLANLVSVCSSIYSAGPKAMPILELQQKKALVLNLLSDFKGSKSKEESFVILGDLISNYTTFYLHYNRYWTNGGGRHQLRNFRKLNPQICDDLFSLYEYYFNNLNKNGLIEYFNKFFSDLEGLDSGYSVSEGMLEVKQSYLVIQVYGLSDYYDFNSNRLPELINLINGKIEDCLIFRTRAIGDTKINEDSVYVIVFASSSQIINQELIPLLNEFVIKSKNVTANFPVNLDLSIVFSQREMIRPVTKWLSDLKKRPSFDGLTETKSFLAGLELFKLFHIALFDYNDDEFLSFLTYVHNLWFPAAYDRGKFFRLDQLNLEKENMLILFTNQYTQQEKILKALFTDGEFRMIPIESLSRFKEIVPFLRPNQLHSTFVNPMVETDLQGSKADWIVYQNVLQIALATLFIPQNKMSYLSFAIMAIIKNKN